jgi:hypothetical protein
MLETPRLQIDRPRGGCAGGGGELGGGDCGKGSWVSRLSSYGISDGFVCVRLSESILAATMKSTKA